MLLQCCVRAGTGCLRDVGALGQTGRACELRVGAGVGSLVVWCLLCSAGHGVPGVWWSEGSTGGHDDRCNWTGPSPSSCGCQDEGASCGLRCWHAGWLFSAWFSAREFERTCVKVFALCIAAVSFVKSDAESFVAVLLHKIGSLDLLCSAIAWRFAFARLCALLAFLSFVLTFAFSRPLLSWNAGRGFLRGWRRSGS